MINGCISGMLPVGKYTITLLRNFTSDASYCIKQHMNNFGMFPHVVSHLRLYVIQFGKILNVSKYILGIELG